MDTEWFFVCPVEDGKLEVQLLHPDGSARSWVQFRDGERGVLIGERGVPAAVLVMAERSREIGGQYVDPDGRLLDPHGHPLPKNAA